MSLINLAEERSIRKRCLSEIEFYEERLQKLEFRYDMLSEEIRQNSELLQILRKEINKEVSP